MKNLLLTIMMVVFVASSAFAQPQKVASAYQYLRDEQPEKAKVEIDAAINYESTKDDAKTWFYRGNTYLQLYLGAHMTDNLKKGMSGEEVKAVLGNPISVRRFKKLPNGEKFSYLYELIVFLANDSVDHWEYPMDEKFRALDDGKLLDVAYNSYVKALEIEPDFKKPELSPGTPQQGISNIGKLYSFHGSTALRADDYEGALKSFEKAIPIYKGSKDVEELSIIFYSAGFAAQSLADTAKAIDYYQKSVGPNMKNRNIYINLANLYMKTDQTEKGLKAAEDGLKVIPGDLDLLITQANIYMHDGRSQEANELLSKAAEKDPTNKQLQYAIGVNYDKMARDTNMTKEVQEASYIASIEAYKRAVEIDSLFFNAAFNLGAMYYNTAADKLTTAGNLPYNATDEYNRLKDSAKEDFVSAIPYLEQAHRIDPKEHNTMIMLRTAYTQTGNTKAYKLIKAELDAE